MLYDDLPGIFKSEVRYNRFLNNEVWIQEEPFEIITIMQISKKACILIEYQHQNISKTTLHITEIIYKYQNHWQIRDIIFSYQHPSDYICIKDSPSNIPIYKLFIDLYYDDFGTYQNVYHSLGEVYLQFENMTAYQRKSIKNHFILGFVPFGGNFNEFILPFISEMKELEQGKIMKVNGQDA